MLMMELLTYGTKPYEGMKNKEVHHTDTDTHGQIQTHIHTIVNNSV